MLPIVRMGFRNDSFCGEFFQVSLDSMVVLLKIGSLQARSQGGQRGQLPPQFRTLHQKFLE